MSYAPPCTGINSIADNLNTIQTGNIILPEEIIKYILSFAPDFRDNLKNCHAELLKNKPIYFWKLSTQTNPENVDDVLNLFKDDFKRWEERFISGLGIRIIWLRALEVSRPKTSNDYPSDTFRIVTAYYGWGREKDHPYRRDNPRSTRGVNLKTGYY